MKHIQKNKRNLLVFGGGGGGGDLKLRRGNFSPNGPEKNTDQVLCKKPIRYHCNITVTVPAIYYSRLFHFLNTPCLSHIYLFLDTFPGLGTMVKEPQ